MAHYDGLNTVKGEVAGEDDEEVDEEVDGEDSVDSVGRLDEEKGELEFEKVVGEQAAGEEADEGEAGAPQLLVGTCRPLMTERWLLPMDADDVEGREGILALACTTNEVASREERSSAARSPLTK